ncbi:hypothetical protein CRI94_09870 [Longibacter salinarum]|uniref:Outer membrane protein beta-barrel domain-containing protein n=1 Tax=Longibacter salinarum TaxID=1850348 RepID=A0A2A8CY32_9BACT|nr:outer membrane beta-barrel protein [Longibacter salinarum]PEN13605.1 hypothetical protein CRI94_09870 [Longibacter salinarum]
MTEPSATSPLASRLLRRVLAFVLLVLLSATSAFAQREITLRPGAGGMILTQPDNLDVYLGSGTNLGLDLGIQVLPKTLPGLQFVLGTEFDRFTTNESDLLLYFEDRISNDTDEIKDGTLEIYSWRAAFRYTIVNADIASKPYFTAGAGIYHSVFQPATFLDATGDVLGEPLPNGDIILLTGAERIETHLGYTLGIGVDFDINETYGFFVEGRYVIITNGDYGNAPTTLRTISEPQSTRYYPIRFGATIRLASFGN